HRIDEQARKLYLSLRGRRRPIEIPAGLRMQFGTGKPEKTESVTAAEYAEWVLEPGDLIDVVYDPRFRDACDRIRCFWIHVEHLEDRPTDARFSEKDDGLFALRGKSGEKAQHRVVAPDLVERFGHTFSESDSRGTGSFQIRYRGKK